MTLAGRDLIKNCPMHGSLEFQPQYGSPITTSSVFKLLLSTFCRTLTGATIKSESTMGLIKIDFGYKVDIGNFKMGPIFRYFALQFQ